MSTTDVEDTGHQPPDTPISSGVTQQYLMSANIAVLRTIDPRQCDRRQLLQVVNMLKARTQDQKRILDNRRAQNHHKTWTDRLRDHRDGQQMTVRNRTSEIERLEQKAEKCKQEKCQLSTKLGLAQDRFIEQKKIHESLLAQKQQLGKRLETLLNQEAEKGISEALAETHRVIKTAFLCEQRREDSIRKKTQWFKKLIQLLANIKKDFLSSSTYDERRFKMYCVDRNGVADIICTEVLSSAHIDPCTSDVGHCNGIRTFDNDLNDVMSIYYDPYTEGSEAGRTQAAIGGIFQDQADGDGEKIVGISSRQL